MPALTGRAALLALVFALVVAVAAPSWSGVGLSTAVLLALLALDIGLAASARALRFSRQGDTAVRLGEPARVTLTVHNPTRRRVHGLLRDAWVPSAGAVANRHRIDVAPGGSARVATSLLPTRRGDRPAHHVTVRTVGPLGLAGRQASHVVPWRVRVLPAFTSRKHLPSRLARLRELDGRSAVRVRGQGTEFDSLRDYVIGDDVRSIDWRATARRQDVVVRTWRPERDRHVLVVLDTSRTSAGRVGDAPRLDAAMDATLLLAALASRAGDRVDLLAYDRRVRAQVRGEVGAGLLPALVAAMAPIEPELVEVDMAGLVSAVLARTPRRSLVVLFTGLDTAPVEEALLPVLGPLVRRHRVLVAAVADPRIDELAGDDHDVDAVYAAASAEQTRAERARGVERLRQRGVEVVDATPEHLAPQLADRYLALKAEGLL